MILAVTVALLALVVYRADAGCSRSNWWSSLDKQGLSRCSDGNDFISGFYRNDRTGWKSDPLGLLEEAECCSRNWPWTNSKTQTMYADWWGTFDRDYTWANCPAGYFLNGLYISGNGNGKLFNIEEGRCSKPADHPPYHGHCYDHDISSCFDNKGLCRCNNDYYVAGIYRGGCDKLYCLEKLRCCKTAEEPEALDELYKVKTRIMDTTMSDMASLANYMGYGWCAGCRAAHIGEDFRRHGDTWNADKSGRCKGYMNDRRLSIAYGDWSFGIKDIKYGEPVIQDLTPETIDSGTLYNDEPTDATKGVTRSETSVRSVTHTTTSSWKNSHELDVKVTYTPSSATGGVGGSIGYKFNYEKSTTSSDETNNVQSNTFTVNTSKILKPNSAAKWKLVLSKTRTSVTYTATIIAKFSTEFKGFLRWGEGPHGKYTNYHYQYRGSGARPTFNYRFGDSSIPFYTALKRQSETNSQPWLWNDMKNGHPNAQHLINDLCNENRYVFKLTGRFDDVIGKHVEFRWESAPLRKRSADRGEKVPDVIHQNSTHVAKALPNDVPLVKLEPPTVNIEVVNQAKIENLELTGS
ncbi:aerolysin-like [Physella acuta]|uniref:aerolysin-like n=1 Tax=Physella acuta TaxID=109671 RepID=UPI0027DDBE62|nr:aerolysin-like [Physella acuta]